MSDADYTEAQLADLPEYMQENVKDGYAWECACGEMYNNARAATRCRKCRKCRTYLPADAKRHALHVVTGEKLGYNAFNLVGERVSDERVSDERVSDERVSDTQETHVTYPGLTAAHTAAA